MGIENTKGKGIEKEKESVNSVNYVEAIKSYIQRYMGTIKSYIGGILEGNKENLDEREFLEDFKTKMVIFGDALARHIVFMGEGDKESLKVLFQDLFGNFENIRLVRKDENVFQYFEKLMRYYDEYLAGNFDLTDKIKKDDFREDPFWRYQEQAFFQMAHLREKLF